MSLELTQQDKDTIWQIVDHAVNKVDGYHQLFSTPLEFSEDNNRVTFNWPTWMRAIKVYLVSQYGVEKTELLTYQVLSEVYNPEKYRQYVANKDSPFKHSETVIPLWNYRQMK